MILLFSVNAEKHWLILNTIGIHSLSLSSPYKHLKDISLYPTIKAQLFNSIVDTKDFNKSQFTNVLHITSRTARDVQSYSNH